MAIIRTVEQLQSSGLVGADVVPYLSEIQSHLDFRIPENYVRQIQTGDHALAQQFVPSTQELLFFPEELEDPIGDERFTPVEGLTHRYPDRVLLKVTYMCGVYCRFCFRRYKVSKQKQVHLEQQLVQCLDYIERDARIWEVILTGGDPLILSDKALKGVLDRLSTIPHIKVIRFHTRMPSAVPERVSDNLLELLKSTSKSLWMALHINSPSELSLTAERAIARLHAAGVHLLSQSVLLRNVNDTSEILTALLRRFVELGIKPYYLHYPDLAQGTQHFRIPLAKAVELIAQLRGEVSGLCIPQLMVDIPGGHGKVTLDRMRARQLSDTAWEFESPLTRQWIRVEYPCT